MGAINGLLENLSLEKRQDPPAPGGDEGTTAPPGGTTTPPGGGTTTPPGGGTTSPPGGDTTPPGGGTTTPPGGTTTPPDGTTPPGGGTTTPPGGTTTPPGGTTTPPGGTTTPPGGTTTPPDGTTTPPGGTTTPPGGTTTPPGGTTTPPGGTTTPPGGTTTPPGGTTTPPDGTSTPPNGTTNPPDGTTTTPPDGTTKPPDDTTTPPNGTTTPPNGTTTPPNGTTNPPDGTTTPPDTTKPPDGTTHPPDDTPKPPDGTTKPPDDTSRPPDGTDPNRGDNNNNNPPSSSSVPHRTWVVTSTYWEPALYTEPAATYLAAQPAWTGSTVYEGKTWIQTTLDAPLTTVYTSTSVMSSAGQTPRTTEIAVTTVVPPGTVIISHKLAVPKKNGKVYIVAGALGGVAVLILIGLAIFFLRKRRNQRINLLGDAEAAPNTRGRRAPPPNQYGATGAGVVGTGAMSDVSRTSVFNANNAATYLGGGAGGVQSMNAAGQRHLVIHNPSSSISPSIDERSMLSGGGASHVAGASDSMYTRGASPPYQDYHHQHQRSLSATSAGGGGGMGAASIAPSEHSLYSQFSGNPQRLGSYQAVPMGPVHEEGAGGGGGFVDDRLGPFHDVHAPLLAGGASTPEDPFAGSEISPPVIVHEDGGCVVDLAIPNGGRTAASSSSNFPPAYHSGT